MAKTTANVNEPRSESAQAATAEQRRRKRAARTAIRMALYPALAIALVVAVFFNPRVREEYYYWQWQWAEKEEEREGYFEALCATDPPENRREKYWEGRGPQLIDVKKWGRVDEMIVRGRGGSIAHLLIPRLSKDNYYGVRAETAEMLGKIGGPAVPALARALYEEDLKFYAVQALAKIGRDAEEAIPALIQALDDDMAKVRYYSAKTLSKIGPRAKDAIPKLVRMLDVPEKIDFNNRQHLEALANRRAAICALGSMGSHSEPAVSKLVEILHRVPIEGSEEAATALGGIGSAARDAVPALKKLILGPSPSSYTTAAAARALGFIGPAARSAAPELCIGLGHGDEKVRQASAESLTKLDVDGEEIIATLTKTLVNHPKWSVRGYVIDALTHFGPQAKSAVPALIGSLRDNQPSIRTRAAKALASIGPQAREAIPALNKVLDDQYKYGHQAAAKALKKIQAKRDK